MSCQHKHDSHPEQTLRLNISEDPVSLDPRLVRCLSDLTIVKHLFEGLTRTDQDGIPQPAIAQEISVSDDLLTYTFTLREAYWNNHDPVTAYDFVTAWQQTLDPSFASNYAYMLYPIKNARLIREGKKGIDTLGAIALDATTLSVQLEAPTPYFLELTAFPTYFPVYRNDPKISNGPFQLHHWTPQYALVLDKNPAYWDAASVHLQHLSFSIISDNNTESHLYQKGELDWLGQPLSKNISTDLLENIAQRYSYPVAGTFWLKFNTLREPFNHPKLRQAFSYAINRQEIITHILKGNQKVATSPLPNSMALQQSPYFEDGARSIANTLFNEALDEEHWDKNHLPRIVLNYSIPSERNMKIAQFIQSQWEEVFGIEVELIALENHLYRRKVAEKEYQVGTGEWIGDFNDPIAFLELFTTGNEMNDTGWGNDLYSVLIEQSYLENDIEKRKMLLQNAEKILVDEMPIAPLYHYAFDYIKNEAVQGVILSPLGLADFKVASIKN